MPSIHDVFFRRADRRVAAFFLAFVLYGLSWATMTSAQGVDDDVLIIANANILTMDPDTPNASAMAIDAGRILAVGDLASVKAAAGSDYEYIDLQGKTVTPGFIESHDHAVVHGAVLGLLDVSPFVTPTLEGALQKLQSEGNPNDKGWIYAFGADQTLYEEKRGPTRQELDELFPDTPVIVIHLSGHGAFGNSKAFEAAGVTKDTPNPKGGNFEKDENGELSGYMQGMPAWLMVGELPPSTGRPSSARPICVPAAVSPL